MLLLYALLLFILVFMSLFVYFIQNNFFIFANRLELCDNKIEKIKRVGCSIYLYLFELSLIYLKVYQTFGIKYTYIGFFVVIFNFLYVIKKGIAFYYAKPLDDDEEFDDEELIDDNQTIINQESTAV